MVNRPIRSLDGGPTSLPDRSVSAWTTAALIGFLVLCGAVSRLTPHPWNATPMGAIALFAGAYLSRTWLALLTPLAALLISDTILEVTGTKPGNGFYGREQLLVYLGFAVVALFGVLIYYRRRPLPIFLAATGSALAFFLITNFGSWLADPIYPRNLAGLMAAYAAGLPFLRNMLLSDLIYVPLIFGAAAWVGYAVPAAAPSRASQ
jgi:hypothetical protein